MVTALCAAVLEFGRESAVIRRARSYNGFQIFGTIRLLYGNFQHQMPFNRCCAVVYHGIRAGMGM